MQLLLKLMQMQKVLKKRKLNSFCKTYKISNRDASFGVFVILKPIIFVTGKPSLSINKSGY